MEVIGSIASFIAIGQAVSSVPKIIQFFRTLPEVQSEVAFLLNELETIRLTHQHMDELVKSTVSDPKNGLPSQIDTCLLDQAAGELKDVIGALEDFCRQSCAPAYPDQQPGRRKKLLWMWKKHNLQTIYQRVQRVRLMLQVSLSSVTIGLQSSQTKLILELREVSQSSFVTLNDGINSLRLMVDSLSDKKPTTVTTPTPRMKPYDEEPPGPETTGSLPIGNVDEALSSLVTKSSHTELLQIQTSFLPACSSNCPCQCHMRTQSDFSPRILPSLLGSAFFRYNIAPVLKRSKCNEHGCRRFGSSISFTYLFPAWLCAKSFTLSLAFGGTANIEASLHFTTGRILSAHDPIRAYLRHSTVDQIQSSGVLQHAYRPWDTFLDGEFIIQRTLQYGNFKLTAFFLQYWKSSFLKGGCDRMILDAAHELREATQQPKQDEKEWVLQKILDYDADPEAYVKSAIHEAILQDDHKALCDSILRHRTSINALDNAGSAPIHLAIRMKSIKSLETLLLAGADMNMRNRRGLTPLSLASSPGTAVPGCARRLIDLGCDAKIADTSNDTALHHAMRCHGSEWAGIIETLLERDNSLASRRGYVGRTPIFALAWCPEGDPDTLLRKLQALLSAGADIDAVDDYGDTAIISAIIYDKLECIKALIEAGSSLKLHFQGGQNILHFAARYSTAGVLSFLEHQDLSQVDEERLDDEGKSPWDLFMQVLRGGSERDGYRKPDPDDSAAFGRLYKSVRDQNHGRETFILSEVLNMARKADETGIETLKPLIEEKHRLGKTIEAKTYEVVVLQIREGMWEAAVESIEERLEVLSDEISRHPLEGKLEGV